MNVANIFRVVSIALPNFAANAPIGAAVDAVDIASSFTINQSTVGIKLTLPNPTDPMAGQLVIVNNIGIVNIIVQNSTIYPSTTVIFSWNGAAWGRVDSLSFVGGITQVNASRTLTPDDDRMTLEVTGAYTLTVPTSLNPGFICRIRQTTAAIWTAAAGAGMTLRAPFGATGTGFIGDYGILQIGFTPTIAYLN